MTKYLPFYCAICGKRTRQPRYKLCSKCYKDWGIELDWVKELIKIERHNYQRGRKYQELTFSEAGLDINGEKIYKEN
jgi:hypothetical protein